MKFFRPFPHLFFARALLPLMIGGFAIALAGCDRSADSKSATKATSSRTSSSKSGGLTLKGDGLTIEAAVATAMLRGYSSQPLSVRIVSGWVNTEKAQRAGKETDEAQKKKQAMGSFGLFTLQIAADKAEKGTYQLMAKAPQAAKGGTSETGTVIINKVEKLGLADDYTSQSGTLTIKSVGKNESGAVTGVEGTFDGQFSNDGGDGRTFSGSFRYAPKK